MVAGSRPAWSTYEFKTRPRAVRHTVPKPNNNNKAKEKNNRRIL